MNFDRLLRDVEARLAAWDEPQRLEVMDALRQALARERRSLDPRDEVLSGLLVNGDNKESLPGQPGRHLSSVTATPTVRPGGVIILPAPCPEGAGKGVGEQRFLAALRDAPDVDTMLKEMRATGYPPGAQRAFVVGQVLSQTQVVVVGAQDPQMVLDCKMTPAGTMEEALAIAANKLGKPLRALIVPHALQTLVRIVNK